MNKLTVDDLLNLVKSYNPDEVEIIKRAYYCYHLTLIKGVKLYSLVDNFENYLWITKDDFNRAYSSSTYNHEELLAMLKYSGEQEKKYNKKNIKKLYLK